MPAVKETTLSDSVIAPRENTHFVGHASAVKTLAESFDTHTLPNAWLLSGPQGIGKATLAYRFARYVLSQSSPNPTMDIPVSNPVFGRIKANSHPDLMTLESSPNEFSNKTTENITVDEIRKIKEFLHLTSSQSPYRVIIIDSADYMNINAANALLKLLEEPPANTVIVLVSHSPGKLLPTIRSRCHTLKMHPPSLAESLTIVDHHLPHLNSDEAQQLMALANHSPGIALQLHQNGGIALYQQILSLFATPSASRVTALHALASQFNKKEALPLWHGTIHCIQYFLGQLIHSSSHTQHQNHHFSEENIALQSILAKYSLAKLFQIWEKVDRLIQDAEYRNLEKKATIIAIFDCLRI